MVYRSKTQSPAAVRDIPPSGIQPVATSSLAQA
jgi:hypothetical protein